MDSTADRRAPRRVVTGHTADGVSVVLNDDPVPRSVEVAKASVTLHEVWSTAGVPTSLAAEPEVDPATLELTLEPPPRGTKIRIIDFQPGQLDPAGLQSPVHRTTSIDYGIVLEGEIVLVLDESEVTLGTGDVVVQRGTSHAWANRGDRVARVAFVMVDATFEPALVDALPAGDSDDITHGAPA